MKKTYISGKITGMEAEAKVLFSAAADELAAMGHRTVNPLELPHEHDGNWPSYMKEDVAALLKCNTIYMLKNWRHSRGATLEHYLATQLNINIIYQ